ncbi:MAG: hypothetical protein AAGJ79_06625 [Verrucomicrobiota bacterium]
MNHESNPLFQAAALRRWFGLIGMTMASLGLFMVFSPEPEAIRMPEKTSTGAVPDTSAPPEEVFKRAFWRNPTKDDVILEAERREWSDTNGVREWQWFLKVRPSHQLVDYLREQNAFHLASAPAIAPIPDPPAWFSPAALDAKVLQSASATMQLVFGADGILYATDHGGGFHLGAEIPVAAKEIQVASAGRLPGHSPPAPRVQK